MYKGLVNHDFRKYVDSICVRDNRSGVRKSDANLNVRGTEHPYFHKEGHWFIRNYEVKMNLSMISSLIMVAYLNLFGNTGIDSEKFLDKYNSSSVYLLLTCHASSRRADWN